MNFNEFLDRLNEGPINLKNVTIDDIIRYRRQKRIYASRIFDKRLAVQNLIPIILIPIAIPYLIICLLLMENAYNLDTFLVLLIMIPIISSIVLKMIITMMKKQLEIEEMTTLSKILGVDIPFLVTVIDVLNSIILVIKQETIITPTYNLVIYHDKKIADIAQRLGFDPQVIRNNALIRRLKNDLTEFIIAIISLVVISIVSFYYTILLSLPEFPAEHATYSVIMIFILFTLMSILMVLSLKKIDPKKYEKEIQIINDFIDKSIKFLRENVEIPIAFLNEIKCPRMVIIRDKYFSTPLTISLLIPRRIRDPSLVMTLINKEKM